MISSNEIRLVISGMHDLSLPNIGIKNYISRTLILLENNKKKIKKFGTGLQFHVKLGNC